MMSVESGMKYAQTSTYGIVNQLFTLSLLDRVRLSMLKNLSVMLLSVTPKILASCSKLCSRPGYAQKMLGKKDAQKMLGKFCAKKQHLMSFF